MEKIKIEGLRDAAYRAYYYTSFYPEKRADETVKGYEQELNEDLESIPESERERYMGAYLKRLFALMSAKSRCMSSMITGPANFPVRRNQKALNIEHARSVEFTEWREKVLKAIKKAEYERTEASKSPEQKTDDKWEAVKRNLDSHIKTIIQIDTGVNTYSSRPLFVSALAGSIKTLAKNGEVEMVKRAIEHIREKNEINKKPIVTEKHSIFKMLEIAQANAKATEAIAEKENQEAVINGVRVVYNFKIDRIQLHFEGKPSPDVISSLKKSAFKWSPSNVCWQRQLTSNAINAAKSILKSIQ